jgi:hypothetical protein
MLIGTRPAAITIIRTFAAIDRPAMVRARSQSDASGRFL